MRLLVYTGKTPLYNASVKGDILLYMTVYMWGLRGRYFLTKKAHKEAPMSPTKGDISSWYTLENEHGT